MSMKNLENRLTFGKVKTKNRVAPFSGYGVFPMEWKLESRVVSLQLSSFLLRII